MITENTKKVNLEKLTKAVEATKARSAWARGVKQYAFDLLDEVQEAANYYGKEPETMTELERYALNGAQDWKQYSEGGCSLCYNGQIAERLCSPSELKRVQYKEGGIKEPNSRESWIDVQSRALYQAFALIRSCAEV